MDSIHKTVTVGFLRAFHTDVQNASKMSKSWVAHTYQSFLLYRQMVNLPLDWEKAVGEVLAQKCQTTMKLVHKELLFAASSEPILRTWPNSHQIHPASAGTGTCQISEKEHFSGMKKNNSWVGVKKAWQKDGNFCPTKFRLCYCIKKYSSFHALKNGHVRLILSW